ncbi:hypothetical protein ACOSP7_012671 [Xanthoceras sorbifolium]
MRILRDGWPLTHGVDFSVYPPCNGVINLYEDAFDVIADHDAGKVRDEYTLGMGMTLCSELLELLFAGGVARTKTRVGDAEMIKQYVH